MYFADLFNLKQSSMARTQADFVTSVGKYDLLSEFVKL